MSNVIMVGCDLHDKTMLLKIAVGSETPDMVSVKNTVKGRATMIRKLKQRAKAAGASRIVFAYEASGLGFGLYDELTGAGIECHVLAPTGIPRSVKHRCRKTDERDAQQLLELLRAYVLAGNELPRVWIPDAQTRDDRERVRMRLEVGEKGARVKAQIKSLLKRYELWRPEGTGRGWTVSYRRWLQELARRQKESPLGAGARVALGSLLRQWKSLEDEVLRLDGAVIDLAMSDRYRSVFYELLKLKGVGPITAMVFLTEIGDLRRFRNRRQIGAYLGLVPSSHESGQANDRKGHISHQGPGRVRRVLCQATWSRVNSDEKEKAAYQRIVEKNPKHKKIAVVAGMRRLAVLMWHRASEAPAMPALPSARARQKGHAPSPNAIASTREALPAK